MEFVIHSNVNLTVAILTNFSISGGKDQDLPFKISIVIILGFLMSMLSLITVLGNTLVILAFVVDKNLRNHSCYFLLNLAVCDILVGFFSISWSIPYTLTGRWTAGTVACKFWLIMDSTLCVSSVYSIVLISHDRFLSVTKAVAYKVLQRTNNATRNALPKIGAAWGIAFLYSFIPVILWDSGTSNVPEQCVYDFLNAWEIMISCLVLFFYLPFISVIYFNLSIYWNIRKRRHKKHMLNLPRKKDQATVFFIKERNLSEEDPLSPSYYVAEEQKPFSMEQTQNQTSLTGNPKESIRQQSNTKNQNASHLSKLEKDKQIAKSLAIIVGVYFICWGPYGLLFLISAISQCICVDHSWYEIAAWLLWSNSSVNPILYPLCHKKFRRAFMRILFHAS